MVFPLRGADGVLRPFLTRIQPVRDVGGRVGRWFGVNTEIFDQVAAEEALRAERDRTHAVLDGMDEGFALLDRDFRILDVNRAAMHLEQRPRDALVGKTHWEAYPGSEASEIGQLYKRAMIGRVPVSLEHRYIWEDGRSAWLDMRAYPVGDGLAIFYRDVTNRKEAEEQASANAERVRLALDAGAIVGTWFWDVGADAFMVDEAFAQAFGIDPALGREGLSLDQVIATVHPDDKAELTGAIEEAIGRGGRYAHQYRVRGFDGQYRWIEANGRVDKSPNGKSISFPGVLIDVEARRAAEVERDQATTLLKTFIEAVPGVVYAKDRQGRMLLGNKGASELIGKPPEHYLGKTDVEFLDDEEQARAVMANDQRIMSSGIAEQVEEEVSFPDGRRAIWFSTKSPLRDETGEVIGLVGSSVDITERKSAEAALRDTSRRLDAILSNTTMAVFLMDHRQHCIYANAAAEKLTGYSFAAMRGRPLHDVVHHKRPDGSHYPLDECPIDRAFPERAQMQGEELFVAPDGSFYPVAFTASPLVDDAGRPVGTVIEARNIADEKARDSQLRELHLALERRVAEEVAERAKAEEALRQAQKMEAVGQLTGGIAHDFNNLLTIITGNVDIARRALIANETSRASRAMDHAQKGAERAAALTQRLLAFSRRQPLSPKPLDADKLIAGMSDLLNRSLGETVQLEVVSTPGLWRVEADPNQLESALLNLAVNARDAMPEGGKLTIETANARLDEDYSAAHAEVAPGNYVVIAVTDTGHGMPKETLARVFDPFFTTKEIGKGTGLGLSMVYGFVKQSGGHVKIYSEPGDGTVVKIYLPRFMGGDDAEEVSANQVVDRYGRGRTILVVEDDDDVRAYTVECLRELGYRAIEAHDGPAALRLLERQEQHIDLLFTDVVMPLMSGRELADRAHELKPGLKVLYTSGYTRNAIVHGGRLDTGVEMIAKPFTYQALADKIANVLDAGQTGRILVAENDPTVRLSAVEALESAGYAVDEAATASEALGRVRAAQGRYDMVVLDARLPEKAGDALTSELRAMHHRLPILIASEEPVEALRAQFAGDQRVGIIAKPYNAAQLQAALAQLGVPRAEP